MDLILLCWLSVQVLIVHTMACNNFGIFTQKWGFQNLQLSIDNQKQFRRGLSTCLFHNYRRMPTMERAFRGTNQHQWELRQKFYLFIYMESQSVRSLIFSVSVFPFTSQVLQSTAIVMFWQSFPPAAITSC